MSCPTPFPAPPPKKKKESYQKLFSLASGDPRRLQLGVPHPGHPARRGGHGEGEEGHHGPAGPAQQGAGRKDMAGKLSLSFSV